MDRLLYKKDKLNLKNFFHRRIFLKGLFSFSLATIIERSIANDQLGGPYRDRFQSFRQTFRVEPDPEEARRIRNNIIKGRKLKKNLIKLVAPDIAENGNVVPINFSVNCSMDGEDYPKVVHILVLDNPFPEIAKFYFSKQSGSANLAIRIRMRQSSEVIAIAEMVNGKIGEDRLFVEVTIGACS